MSRRRALRSFVALIVLCSSALPLLAAENTALQRGTAITDPLALRELDHGRFSIARMLSPERSADVPLASDQLFSLSSMKPVRAVLEREFERYIAQHRAASPD